MKLDKILIDTSLLKKFVADNFQPLKISKLEKLESNHPLQLLNFNRILNNAKHKFTLFSLPVHDVFVLEKDSLHFCSFLLMEISSDSFDRFIENLGYPENILKEDYIRRDFDFLFWAYKDFQIFVNKHYHLGKSKKDSYIIQLLNMPYENIVDIEKI